MKKERFFGFIMFALLALAALSCKSAPPAAPPPKQQQSGPSLDALNAAVARAQEARKRAADFDSPLYFPSDWDSAEEQFNAAGKMPKTTDADVSNAVSAYNAVADTYDGIFGLTIPLYAQAREDEIMAARAEVLDTGLVDTFPDYLPPADNTALEALSQYESKDYYAARDSARTALAMYQVLKDGAGAYLLRGEIDGRDFEYYDLDGFDHADSLLIRAMEQYDSANYNAAQTNAAEARSTYSAILAKAWAAYAAQRADLADGERQAALDVKANIAVKDIFGEADEYFQDAAAAMKDENYEEAAQGYTQAEAMFTVASRAATEKRRLAAESIREAENKIDESDETARQAEIILTGGSE